MDLQTDCADPSFTGFLIDPDLKQTTSFTSDQRSYKFRGKNLELTKNKGAQRDIKETYQGFKSA